MCLNLHSLSQQLFHQRKSRLETGVFTWFADDINFAVLLANNGTRQVKDRRLHPARPVPHQRNKTYQIFYRPLSMKYPRLDL